MTCSPQEPTHRGVIQDDVTAGHVAMENMLLHVLDEGALQRGDMSPATSWRHPPVGTHTDPTYPPLPGDEKETWLLSWRKTLPRHSAT